MHKYEEILLNYDLKQILLGENYKHQDNTIKNILLAKYNKNYHDKPEHYFEYSYYKNGHIENYQIVDDLFKSLFPNKDRKRKDIMNSFWSTYKCYLQISYPNIFMPIGTIRKGNTVPLKLPFYNEIAPDFGYPPFTSRANELIHDKYLYYYNENFKDLKACENMTWCDFLYENFDKFPKVHDSNALREFAKLTHSVGNLIIVEEGFNSRRGYRDYWDFALLKLKNEYIPSESWHTFIDNNLLNDYTDENYNVLPCWTNHLNIKAKTFKLLPQTESEIIEFLNGANDKIKKRATYMSAHLTKNR